MLWKRVKKVAHVPAVVAVAGCLFAVLMHARRLEVVESGSILQ